MPFFEPVKIKDPQRDITPGQVYCIRGVDTQSDEYGQDIELLRHNGTGGHTGIVLDFISDTENSGIVLMSNNRDISINMDGPGARLVPLNDRTGKSMFFSCKGSAVAAAQNTTSQSTVSAPAAASSASSRHYSKTGSSF